jgi:hypothetical protein
MYVEYRLSHLLLYSLSSFKLPTWKSSSSVPQIITYYAATIFEQNIGLSPFLSRLLAACNGTEYFMASWIAIFTIEKFGRRSLMLFGAAGQAMAMAVLAGTTSPVNPSTGLGITAAVFLFVFNSFFAIGWLGMTW